MYTKLKERVYMVIIYIIRLCMKIVLIIKFPRRSKQAVIMFLFMMGGRPIGVAMMLLVIKPRLQTPALVLKALSKIHMKWKLIMT